MNWNPQDLLDIEHLDFEDSFSLAKYVSQIKEEQQIQANEIIINILEIWDKVEESTKQIWIDLIESAGFYPYLLKIVEKNSEMDITSEIRSAFHSSKKLQGITLHKEQKYLLNLIAQGRNLIVSAPTSFGKSLLIQEIIASNKYENILIIQPTLALINETRIKLKIFNNSYKIIVNTSQILGDKNIFILTAERVLEYDGLPKIDYFVLDEFYKLSSLRDDERSDVLNIALKKVLDFNPTFYFIGPNIDYIPEGFKERYNALFYKTQYSLVNSQIEHINISYQATGVRKQQKEKEEKLFELLNASTEQSIIYVSSPGRAYNLAKGYFDYLVHNDLLKIEQYLPLNEWIEENLSPNWGFNGLIKNKIGVHSGIIPKHLVHTMIEYFNEGKLNVLFCTSTIIEGVNTSAKNVFIFDNYKGPNELDFFDFSNIKGRAGRLLQHYTGRVYVFDNPPTTELIELDIPFHDQKIINDEILINFEREQVHAQHIERYDELNDFDEDYLKIIKKNSVSVEGQKEIIRQLETEIRVHPNNIIWSGLPTYKQLSFLLDLAWNNLLKPTETTFPMTLKKLPVSIYKHLNKSVSELIKEEIDYLEKKHVNWSSQKVTDAAIENVFREKRHWISYKVPKWLNVMDSLQKLVCMKIGLSYGGDYLSFASILENDGVEEELSLLIDLGLPASTINKIKKIIPSDLEDEDLVRFVKTIPRERIPSVLQYEIDKIQQL
ncbi:DEAD/DEAH box helicase [Exiguobacterium mexicanum]|uniref:DEAD/DEAH box helicase n=1 Tax=Exiguobacterium mexicanum TaxID=340146 RepID=A0ABT7MNA3_9BACL|nr:MULTISPECIES: DEAD/DEAH box helicase [Exiguobacterium]MDL5376671.1 DEAD/DEAH box helicase [Exiguobacterium mexicanum]